MISGLIAVAMLGQPPVCDAPPNAAALWDAPPVRIAFVGETHGTVQTPAAFAELVCEASATQPVVAALEISDVMQADLDAWMASDGGEAARAALLAPHYWTFTDGRSSQAMVAMLERLRYLKAAGRDISVKTYQPSHRRPDGFDQSYYEIEMANLLIDAAYSRPDALVLALGGSLHARRTFSDRHGFLFAAGHLGRGTVRSVRVAYQGGRTWACFSEQPCGDSDLGKGDVDPALRGIMIGSIDNGAYDGVLAVGPTTASPPARPAP